MGINSGSGSARGGCGGAYQDGSGWEESNFTSEDTPCETPNSCYEPPKTCEIKTPIQDNPLAKKNISFNKTLKGLAVIGYLGLCTLGGVELQVLDDKYIKPQRDLRPEFRYNPPAFEMTKTSSGLFGLFFGGLMGGIIYYSVKNKNKYDIRPTALQPASDDDSHPDEKTSDYRGSRGY